MDRTVERIEINDADHGHFEIARSTEGGLRTAFMDEFRPELAERMHAMQIEHLENSGFRVIDEQLHMDLLHDPPIWCWILYREQETTNARPAATSKSGAQRRGDPHREEL